MSIAERGPFGGRFLNPAFTKVALARSDQRRDFFGRMSLGDRN